MTKIILHFCTPTIPITNSMVCWFQNSFFGLVVPSKLSWGHTLKVFVPQNGLIFLNAGPKQLCSFTHSLTNSRFTIYFRKISPSVSKFAMDFWTKYWLAKCSSIMVGPLDLLNGVRKECFAKGWLSNPSSIFTKALYWAKLANYFYSAVFRQR